MKRVLVNGAGGFIGGHLVKRLKEEGCWVRGVDVKHHEFERSRADQFVVGDLRDPAVVSDVVSGVEEVYQLAADMGGAGYIFTGEHDAAVMHNSATINLTAGSNQFSVAARFNANAVPEPASIIMMLTGMPLPLVVMGLLRRRRAAA